MDIVGGCQRVACAAGSQCGKQTQAQDKRVGPGPAGLVSRYLVDVRRDPMSVRVALVDSCGGMPVTPGLGLSLA